jgi:hypothetical protein
MAHLSSIGAGMFSDLSIALPTTPPTSWSTVDTQIEFDALFAAEIESVGGTKGAATYVRMKNVREFPPMGTPPNIVNVPTYGQKSSQQVQGQSDAPSLEITVNYVASDWASGTLLGDAVADGKQHAFRFALLNAEPTGYISTAGQSGLGKVENTVFYWVGKIEAMLVNPQLTDANTATITMSIQSKFFGAYTVASA